MLTLILQDVRSMLSLDRAPTRHDAPFYKKPGDWREYAIEEVLLSFRSQEDRSEIWYM